MFICLSQTYQILSIFLCAQNAFPVTFFFFLFLKKFLIFKNKYGSGLLKLILIRRIWIRNPDKIPFSLLHYICIGGIPSPRTFNAIVLFKKNLRNCLIFKLILSYIFCLYLSYIYMCGSGSVLGIRIRIHKASEYGSNTNQDPQHGSFVFFGSSALSSFKNLIMPDQKPPTWSVWR